MTEDHIAQAVQDASGPLRITGGNTRGFADHISGAELSLADHSGITLYEPGAMTLVVKAGTPIAQINDALAAENQRLAFEPPNLQGVLGRKGQPTIGGAFATNGSGPRRIAMGAARDFLLGVRFVDGTGTVIKNGGRVMKNVTGYDLVKLMAGSYGTLGVLTEVSLKVMPAVAATTTLVLDGLNDATAIRALSSGLGSPYEVTGAAHDPAAGKTYLRLEGFAKSVAYRSEALAKHLAAFGTATAQDFDWTAIRDLHAFNGKSGDLWRISVPPSKAADLAARLGATSVQYDWGGGLIWALTPAGHDLRSVMTEGHATLIRGAGHGPVFHPEPAPIAAITAGLRAKFDPRGIFNQGIMG